MAGDKGCISLNRVCIAGSKGYMSVKPKQVLLDQNNNNQEKI